MPVDATKVLRARGPAAGVGARWRGTEDHEDAWAVSDDVLAMSFLDVLCCGLGAAILVFLVFSVLPHQGESRQRQSTGGPQRAGFDRSSQPLAARASIKDIVKSASVVIRAEVTGTAAASLKPTWRHRPPGNGAMELVLSSPAKTDSVVFELVALPGMDPNLGVTLDLSAAPSIPPSTKFHVHASVSVGGTFRDMQLDIPASKLMVPGGHTVLQLTLLKPQDQWLTIPRDLQ